MQLRKSNPPLLLNENNALPQVLKDYRESVKLSILNKTEKIRVFHLN
jgi:hypothetical protein